MDARLLENFKDVVNRSGKNDLNVQIPFLREIGDGYLREFHSSKHWTDALKVRILCF